MQTRQFQHLQELLPCPHINGLRYQFPAPVIHKALGNSFHVEYPVDLASRIEQDRVGNLSLGNERPYLGDVFIRYGQDNESLVLKRS